MRKLYNLCVGIPFVKKLMEKPLFAKLLSWEFVSYIIFGVLTTVVNFLTYFIFDKLHFAAAHTALEQVSLFTLFKVNFTLATIANIVAWIAAVAFAYITNKIYVFESKSTKPSDVLREIAGFVSGRLLTLVLFEVLLFTLLTSTFGINDYISKLLISVFVIIFNFVFSKLIVFKNKNKEVSE